VDSLNEQALILPPGYSSWREFGDDFTYALRQARMNTVHWLTREESNDFMLETSQWGLLLSESASGLRVSQDILAQAMTEFCGDATTEQTFDTGVSEFIATHVSYSGCAAVVHENTDDVELRVQWLWKVVALLYGSLLESAEPLYNTTVTLMNARLDGVPSTSFDIRAMRFMIDLMHNEAKPVVICSESFDAAIYEAIWESWGGDEVQQAIDARMSFLASALADMASQRTSNLQTRLNVVVFVVSIFFFLFAEG